MKNKCINSLCCVCVRLVMWSRLLAQVQVAKPRTSSALCLTYRVFTKSLAKIKIPGTNGDILMKQKVIGEVQKVGLAKRAGVFSKCLQF